MKRTNWRRRSSAWLTWRRLMMSWCDSSGGSATQSPSSCCCLKNLAARPSLRAHRIQPFCRFREGADFGLLIRRWWAIWRSSIARERYCLKRVCVPRTGSVGGGVEGPKSVSESPELLVLLELLLLHVQEPLHKGAMRRTRFFGITMVIVVTCAVEVEVEVEVRMLVVMPASLVGALRPAPMRSFAKLFLETGRLRVTFVERLRLRGRARAAHPSNRYE